MTEAKLIKGLAEGKDFISHLRGIDLPDDTIKTMIKIICEDDVDIALTTPLI